MPITWTTDSASISTTEYSIVADSTSLATDTNQGIYHIKVGLENMVAGDQYELKLYEKAASGATKRVQETWTFTGVSKDFNMPATPLGNGWDFTIDRIAGADRTIYWTIVKVA